MPHRTSFVARSLAGSLTPVVLLTTACSAWHRRAVPAPAPAGAPETAAFRRGVRVTSADGGRIRLTATRIVGDSLVGDPRGPGRRTAVALGDVRRIDERRSSPRRTVGLVFGITAGVVGLGAILISNAVRNGDWDFGGGLLY